MNIYEIGLKNPSRFVDGCYHSMVVIAETEDLAFNLASIYADSYHYMESYRKENVYIKLIGISNETEERFVTGNYVPYNYDNDI